MTEHWSRRWVVTFGAASLPVRTRHDDVHAAIELEIGTGDTNRTVTATILSFSDDACVVSIEGQSTVVRLAPYASGCHAMAGGETFSVTANADAGGGPADGDEGDVTATSSGVDLDALSAPMPATVSAILVEPGAVVATGDTLVRLEAMKMEQAIRAPAAGRVTAIACRVGELVQPGRPLVALEARPTTAGKSHR